MENKNFKEVWDYDASQSIQKLTSEASKLKSEIFRTIVMDRDLNKKNIQFFESFVNEFLKFWTEHSESIQSSLKSMSSIKDPEGLRSIEYEYVKNFIYAKYDYASVLKFTEGVITGIEDEEMTKSREIENFRDHTISMAFNNQSPTVGGLLSSVLLEELGDRGRKEVGMLELKMFENIRNYDGLFNRASRIELYQAISKTIEYITENDVIEEEKNFQNVKLFISFINNVVEFITYSLSAYALRIFIISRYVSPFIRHAAMEDRQGRTPDHSDPGTEMGESFSGGWMDGVSREDISENPRGNTSNVFHPMTEMTIKDPLKAKEFFEKFHEMLRLIGIGTELDGRIPTYERSYIDRGTIGRNKIYEKLNDNPLFELLQSGRMYGIEHHTKESVVMEYHQTLKSSMYNKYQGLQGPTTARNEFLHVVRGMEYGDSLAQYKEQARDLYMFALQFNKRIQDNMKAVRGASDSEFHSEKMAMGVKKFLGECSKFLIDFYQESMWAIAQKATYIERRINELNTKDVKRIEDFIALDVPDSKPDTSMLHMTNLSVPATMRMPTEHQDLFALPIFEELEMHNEYLRSLPEFQNSSYLTEGAIATIINAIRSLLQGLRKKVDDFFLSREFKAAREWVSKHKQELQGMVFTQDVNMEILPYKNNIAMHQGFDNLKNGLQNFDPATHGASPEAFGKFVDGLYPSPTIREWFRDPQQPADIMWKNLFLFWKEEEAQVPNTETGKVTISGADITARMAEWITTIEGTETTRVGFNDTNLAITNAVNNLNSRMTNWNPTPAAPVTPGTPTPVATPAAAPATATTESVLMEMQSASTQATNTAANVTPTDTTTGTPLPQSQPAGSPPPAPAAVVNRDTVGTAVQQAIKDIWIPITGYTVKAVRDQYQYIKTAYGLGTSGTATPAQ